MLIVVPTLGSQRFVVCNLLLKSRMEKFHKLQKCFGQSYCMLLKGVFVALLKMVFHIMIPYGKVSVSMQQESNALIIRVNNDCVYLTSKIETPLFIKPSKRVFNF